MRTDVKNPVVKNPRLWATGALGALALAATAATIRRPRSRPPKEV
jgi:hypothetical protein